MTEIQFTADGGTYTLDLASLTALDAIAFRLSGLGELEQWVTRILGTVADGTPTALLAADRGIAAWLLLRRSDPTAAMASVAASVPFFEDGGD